MSDELEMLRRLGPSSNFKCSLGI